MATRRPTAPPHPSPSETAPPGGRRGAIAVLAGLVLARAAVFVALGPGFVSDDWSLAGAMHLDGHQGGFILDSRPGSFFTFTAVYGIAGLHPVTLFALVTLGYLAVVVSLWALLRRFVAPATALTVTAVWVLLPTHTTITVWGATTNSLVGMTLAVLGLLLMTHGRWLAAGMVMAASVLSYELSTPLLLVGAMALPNRWQRVPAGRDVVLWQRLVATAMVAGAAAWSAANSVYVGGASSEQTSLHLPNPVVWWSAHFGSGLFATASAPAVLRFGLLAASIVAVAVALVAWYRGERGREEGPALVVAGLAVMVAGAWITFLLPIASHGVVDRLYAVSSIGSAFVLVGLYRLVQAHQPTVAAAGAVTLLAICVVGQFVGLRSWSEAGDDSVALMHYLERHFPDAAHQSFVVGPTAPYRNGVVGVSGGHGKWTKWVWFGVKDGNIRTAVDPSEFVARDGEILVRWPDVRAEEEP